MKKLIVIVLLFIFILFIFIYFFKGGIILDHLGIHLEEIHTSDNYSTIDANQNGIPDALDIVEAARKEVRQQTIYKSRYYQRGYPPSDGMYRCDLERSPWREYHLKRLNGC